MKLKPTENNNLNEFAEPFKSLAFAFKDESRDLKQSNAKLLRVLRDHERRIVALEQEIEMLKEKKK